MSEYYEFEQMLEGLDEELVLNFAGVILMFALAVLLVAVVGYIFQSIGLYTIAKRRGIANPWLAWLPWVGYYWIAGSVADQYQYVVNGAVKNKRMILLVLSLASIALYMFAGADEAGAVLSLLQSAVSIATLVFWNWSLYELYTSCKPRNNVLFLVLGIIFGFLVPYFIFACRNKEEGMPPRREEPQYGYQPAPEPQMYKEPWDNQ